MTRQELQELQFIALAYANAWCRASKIEQALNIDIEFLQNPEALQEAIVIVDVAKQAHAATKQYF